jgi:porin
LNGVTSVHPKGCTPLGVWTPTNWLAIVGGVLDPNSKADNFAVDAFDRVNLYLTAVISYKLGGLPGQIEPAYNWSNQPHIDLGLPFGALSPTQIPQAVGVLLGSPLTARLPINFRADSWFAIVNIS